jgi:hypothetical protein
MTSFEALSQPLPKARISRDSGRVDSDSKRSPAEYVKSFTA